MEFQIGLQEWLENSVQEDGNFVIDTDEKANWALRKIKAKQLQIAENAELAAKEILKIQAWVGGVNGNLQNDVHYFEGLLQEYAFAKKLLDPKFKSHKLPEGTFRYKKQQPEFIREEKSLINFFEENGLENFVDIETVKTPKWGDFKKECEVKDGRLIHKETGLVVDVVGVVEREEKFEVVV